MAEIKPSPEAFWSAYREELRSRLTKGPDDYKSIRNWTPVAVGAAKKVCEKWGLVMWPEYLHLDLAAGTRRKDDQGSSKDNWRLQIAYEHENAAAWRYELCKLTDIVADLRVLSSYDIFTNQTVGKFEKRLQEAVNRLEDQDRLFRLRDSQWLFVFGPRCKCGVDVPFKAWKLDKDAKLVPILEDEKERLLWAKT